MVDSPRCEFFTTDYTDCTDFFIFSREFALFAVNFNSTMRNPKEPQSFLIKLTLIELYWFFEIFRGVGVSSQYLGAARADPFADSGQASRPCPPVARSGDWPQLEKNKIGSRRPGLLKRYVWGALSSLTKFETDFQTE